MTEAPLIGPSLADLLEIATELATRAGALTLDWFQSSALAVDVKSDGSPVTEADRAAEAFLREQLAQRFPDDTILGEEHDDSIGSSGRSWIIDPIDGTKSFARGVPLYSTLLAARDHDGPAIGVIVLPALNEVVAAARGLGCFFNGSPCRVSSVGTMSQAAVTASGFGTFPIDKLEALTRSGAIVRTWGDGYGYSLLATGRVEAMLDFGLSHWDIAPMHVIVPEAGGTLTDWHGQAEPHDGNTLATNGDLHQDLLALLE